MIAIPILHQVTVDTAKGAKTRSVSWMPILTQRGVFEKVNSVESSSRNSWQAVVKEIAPDLGVVGTCPMEGAGKFSALADRT
jgi:hypothetical protein